MNEPLRPFSGEHPTAMSLPPAHPWRVCVLGAGRVGGSFARALERAGHEIVGELRRDDDVSALAEANVIVIAVPDDLLAAAVATVDRVAKPGAMVVHTCGLAGLEPLRNLGPLVAAIHPAVPVATKDQRFDGVTFGVTCREDLRQWCERFVGNLGGTALFLTEEQRPLYHAALVMASNFAVSLAGDGADLLGGYQIMVPLLRATVENIAAHGPDDALTGPVVRGDAGTVRAHLDALPPHLTEVYVVNARRALARAVAAGRLDAAGAKRIEDVLAR